MGIAVKAPFRRAAKESDLRANRSLVVIATVAFVFLLYWGEPFFVPFLIGILLSYALSPIVTGLTMIVRYRVIAAALVVLSIVALLGVAAWAWSDDLESAWQKLPVAAKSISKSLQKMAKQPGNPVGEVQKAAAEVESLGRPSGTPTPAAAAQQPAAVPMWQVLYRGWKTVMTGLTQAVSVLFLVFFMLASGDLFKRKFIAIAGDRLSERKDALRTIEEIDRQIRSYLGVLLASNVLVGLGTWAAFAMLGMQYAGLWGAAAGILHTAPYFGPTLVAGASLVAAFMQFGQWPIAFAVAGSTILVATLVGMVFATWLASRTTDINVTASFVGLLFFGWIWGLWGVLLAIPILAIVRTIAERHEGMKPVAELLGR
jgi:predicted PurR-regulated permease PerM